MLCALPHAEPLDAKIRNKHRTAPNLKDEELPPEEELEPCAYCGADVPKYGSPQFEVVRDPPSSIHTGQQDDPVDQSSPFVARRGTVNFLLKWRAWVLTACYHIDLARN